MDGYAETRQHSQATRARTASLRKRLYELNRYCAESFGVALHLRRQINEQRRRLASMLYGPRTWSSL